MNVSKLSSSEIRHQSAELEAAIRTSRQTALAAEMELKELQETCPHRHAFTEESVAYKPSICHDCGKTWFDRV